MFLRVSTSRPARSARSPSSASRPRARIRKAARRRRAEAGNIPGLRPPEAGRSPRSPAQLSTWRETLIEGPLAVARRVFEDSGLEQALRATRPEAENRLQNVRELVGSIGDWARSTRPTLSAYLEHVTLQTAIDELDENAATARAHDGALGQGPGVRRRVRRRRRGRAVPYAAATTRSTGTRSGPRLEEERRLAYRGDDARAPLLWLFHARRRMLFGGTQTCPQPFPLRPPPPAPSRRRSSGAKEQAAWSLPDPERRPPGVAPDHDATGTATSRFLGRPTLPTLEQEDPQSVVVGGRTSFRRQAATRSATPASAVGKVVDIESGAEVKLSVECSPAGAEEAHRPLRRARRDAVSPAGANIQA